MKNTTTAAATTLASAGMNAEGAAMHAAILENIRSEEHTSELQSH